MDASGNPWIFYDDAMNVMAVVNVRAGTIPSMTITSHPGQLPRYLSRYRYVRHFWNIEAEGSGWVADVDFHYFDSEVLAGNVTHEDMLRGMRIAPGTAYWEDPIAGTFSVASPANNFVTVLGITPSNSAGDIALAHDWFIMPSKQASGEIPQSYALGQNFPNPFNPSTSIKYALPEEAHVTLTVTNSLGETVATLADEVQPAGTHTATFQAEGLPSGVYMYTLKAGSFTQSRAMILGK